jgi:hypothetical protein
MRVVFFLSLLVSFALHAADEAPLLAREPDGWIDLTPPKDFAGWKRVPLDPFPDKPVWTLSDDGKTLHVDGIGAKEMLLTEKEFGDGTFHVEWRFLKERPGQKMYNGGVYVRTQDNQNWVQAQAARTPKPPSSGDIFSEFQKDGVKERREIIQAANTNREKPVEEWNTMELVCKGPEVALWFNGAVTVVWKDCPFKKGRLGFQAEFAPMEIRNIKFKPAK